jgi:hypothetical protein
MVTTMDEERARRANWIHRPRFDGSLDPKPPARERKLDTAPIDWHAIIEGRVLRERARTTALLTELVAELQGRAADDLESATRSLINEVADLRVVVSELRAAIAAEKTGTVLDLPSLPLRRGLN